MGKYILSLIALLSCLTAAGQIFKPIPADQAKKIVANIETASRRMESFECSFTETREIAVMSDKQISQGKMYYKRTDKLRWEYTSPSRFVFICNGDRTAVDNGSAVDRGSGGVNMAFREVGRMVLACINGHQLTDPDKFSAAYYTDGNTIKIELTPRNRRMAQMMSSMWMLFSMTDYSIQAIVISRRGDSSFIEMKNKTVNGPLDDTLFVL